MTSEQTKKSPGQAWTDIFARLDTLKKQAGIEREEDSDDWALLRLFDLLNAGEKASLRLCWVDIRGRRHYRLQIRRENGIIDTPLFPIPSVGETVIEEKPAQP